ncbi:MAG: hypothetical protein AAGG75_26365 [Bacteroidota bacterium]
MSEQPNWNFEEFSTFLLLYAADADLVLSPEEETLMKARLNEQSYEKVKTQYDSLSDYQRVQTIMSFKGLYYPTVERRDELIALIKKQFMADGDYSLLEKNMLRLLEKLM